MKSVLTIVMLTSFLWACTDHKHSSATDDADSGEVSHQNHEVTDEDLVLNNGAKWKADNSTSSNVDNLLVIISSFKSGTDKSLNGYKKVADDLQQGLDKMISECKMQGPDHDALHKWLMPLMEKVDELKEASNETEATKSFEAIEEHVKLFSQYFQL